ncbi:MAG: cellulose biosynthesis protein BcsS [Hyphomicrobiaceae bacterium]
MSKRDEASAVERGPVAPATGASSVVAMLAAGLAVTLALAPMDAGAGGHRHEEAPGAFGSRATSYDATPAGAAAAEAQPTAFSGFALPGLDPSALGLPSLAGTAGFMPLDLLSPGAWSSTGSKLRSQPAAEAHVEAWVGTEITRSSLYGYTGTVIFLGESVAADGFLLRLDGGGGRYSYSGERPFGPRDAAVDVEFAGVPAASSALLGYQQHVGGLTAKLYLGADYVVHTLTPSDPFNSVEGSALGMRGVAELWYDVGPGLWVSADAGYSTAFGTYAATLKAGYDIDLAVTADDPLIDRIGIGLEAGAFGNETFGAGRVGLVGRARTRFGEVTLTGGLSGDYENPTSPYGAVSLLYRY